MKNSSKETEGWDGNVGSLRDGPERGKKSTAETHQFNSASWHLLSVRKVELALAQLPTANNLKQVT
jgi:hypothetical protein